MTSAPTAAAIPLASASFTPPKARIVEAALRLFTEHGVSGTSLQRIADEIGVTKAAVYHQYNTKEEIVLAVAEVVLAGLEAGATAAEAERSRSRAREVLISHMIDLAVESRRLAGILQRDPVMLRSLDAHEPFRRVMERVNRLMMGGASDPQARVRAALIIACIGGAVIHPLVADLDDESLRAEMRKQTAKLVPL